MPRNRNNDKIGKSFDIGTKIEYNGKLYEVIESVNCGDCSLASICSNSNLSAGDRNDDALSRDKRVNIFGECSEDKRPDTKSVVFIEIAKDNSNELSHTVIPLFTDDRHIQLRPVEFDLPNGYEIDVEASDLTKGIIKFKSKWLTLEQVYKLANDNDYPTSRSAIKDFSDGKLTALANLMDIARYFNGNWNYHNRGDNCGYLIAYDKTRTIDDGYQVVHINSDTDMYFGNIMFKNEADAQYVIDNSNFRVVLDRIFKV